MIKLRLLRHRIHTSSCDGTLSIDGVYFCDTTEQTFYRVPTGTYRLRPSYNNIYRRKVPTLIPIEQQTGFGAADEGGHCLTMGNGIFNIKDSRILLGTLIAPGCLSLSRIPFMHLYDRICKSRSRGHEVILTVTE